MKHTFKIICFLSISLLLLFSCSKDKEEYSSNYPWSIVSCRVDGKPWNECGENTNTHTKQSNVEVYTHYDGYYQSNTLILIFYNRYGCEDLNKDSITQIEMDLYHFKGEGEYILRSFDRGVCNRPLRGMDNQNIFDYSTNDSITGKLTITKYDTLARTVSGTFFFDAYATGMNYDHTPQVYARLGYTKHITNGVFNNVPYQIRQ